MENKNNKPNENQSANQQQKEKWSTPNIESSFRLVLFGFRVGVKGYVWGA